jgi:rare lipoprotein A
LKALAATILLCYPAFSCESFSRIGWASFYGEESGNITANGEVWKPEGFTAAMWDVKFNTILRVTNLSNHKSVIVRLNDRGPNKRLHRLIDVSTGAARVLLMINKGLTKVRVDTIG